MPYCPKCDMEFVEGITVCTDCGGILYGSREDALAAQKEAKEKARQQFLETMARMEESIEGEKEGEGGIPPANRQSTSPRSASLSTVYVKKSSRYEDMKSSASAFLLMGCATLLLAGVFAAGVLPVSSSSRLIFTVVLGLMGISSLYICIKTRKSAAIMKEEAVQENQETENRITAFLAAHSALLIDQQLKEDAKASGESLAEEGPEELSLKRYELIQDYLITENDLPDPAYVDLLTEEIYNRLFGQE